MRNPVRKRDDIAVVLLDVDGTLIDSNNAHAQSWVDVGTEFGYDISFDEVRRLIGMGGDKVLPRLTGLQEESAAGERILERRGEIFRGKYLPVLSPFPRTRELLKRMRADGSNSWLQAPPAKRIWRHCSNRQVLRIYFHEDVVG